MDTDNTQIARIAVDARYYGLFDYKIKKQDDIIGRRVCVPFRGKTIVGLVLETTDFSTVNKDKIKAVETVFDDIPALPSETIALIRFCSEYYHWPIGLVVAAILPSVLRRTKSFHLQPAYRLTNKKPVAESLRITSNIKKLLALFLANETLSMAAIKSVVASPKLAIERLLASGTIEKCRLLPSLPENLITETLQLTDQQNKAVAATVLKGFVPHLLFGATGSGKSEVYFRLIQSVLEKKQQALILTPEIHLTPQIEEKLRHRFSKHRLVVLHSDLSDSERARRWLMALMGDADIVLGTRLAVFTPMPRLGIIIVDEEHDESYKQQAYFSFSAVQVAVWRAKQNSIPFIAGSATPSLESYQKTIEKKWQLLRMPERLHNATTAKLTFELIEENAALDFHGMQPSFIKRLKECVQNGNQALIFINRRAYSPVIMCQNCDKTEGCQRCSTTMTVHKRRGLLACHWCGYEKEIPIACSSCRGKMSFLGSGTQRIEEAVLKLFPTVSTLRLDSDIATPESITDSVYNRYQLLIGTQIIAKGHNFPGLALVGILNADAGLLATDLRSEERLFALLSQVIGRGTRNPNGCHVMIQTAFPNQPFFKELISDNVETSWQRQLDNRQQVQMPPFGHLALLRARDKNLSKLDKFMHDAVRITKSVSKKVMIFDPVVPPIERVNNYYRKQLLLHSKTRSALHNTVHQAIPLLPNTVHWAVDIDPKNFSHSND